MSFESITSRACDDLLGLTGHRWIWSTVVDGGNHDPSDMMVVYRAVSDSRALEICQRRGFVVRNDVHYAAGIGGLYFSTSMEDAVHFSTTRNDLMHMFMCVVPGSVDRVQLHADNRVDIIRTPTVRDTVFVGVGYGRVRRNEYVVAPQEGNAMWTPPYMAFLQRQSQ